MVLKFCKMETTTIQTGPLLNLPVEMVDAILEAVSSLAELREPSLAALSQTCKVLHDRSARYLYRDVSTKGNWLLARTLIARPDLAKLVKSLDVPERLGCATRPPPVPAEVKRYHRRKMKRIKNPRWREWHDGRRSLLYYSCACTPPCPDRHGFHARVVSDVYSSLCRNLETLRFYPVLSEPRCFWTPNSLMKLTKIAVKSPVWMDLQDDFDLGPLFLAAPNIEKLRLISMDLGRLVSRHTHGLELPRLKTMGLFCCRFTAKDLGSLLEIYPSLEELSVVFDYWKLSFYPPQETTEWLLVSCKAPSLKRLRLTIACNLMNSSDDCLWQDIISKAREAFDERGIEFEVHCPPNLRQGRRAP
ncbi:hypothetical protein QBC34DRAFT_383665 [Podospora aff. communis PSN243]|uniref:F-box domain-containing protein n=1 Tax=Podospora aff. communis PSN243 TaxID=3040156 RepID=A0AAV9GDQ0_9PEZI|nr:hypothetical protein QBC34DRAFT_383665 [Podospora aff. communis PSN243]